MANPDVEAAARQMIAEGYSNDEITAAISKMTSGGRTGTGTIEGTNLDQMSQDTLRKSLRGVGSTLVEGIPKGIMAIPAMVPEILKQLWSTGEGAYNLYNDFYGTLHKAGVSLSEIPGDMRDKLISLGNLAKTDPEGFGQEMGDFAGQAIGGAVVAGAAPFIPKGVARRVGPTLEALGKRAKFPLQLAGAHQVVAGNVVGGIGTMLAPEFLETGGRKIREFGGLRLAPADAAKLETKFSDAMTNRNVAFADEQVKAQAAADKQATRLTARKERIANQFEDASRARDANDAALTRAEGDKEGLVSGPKKVTETSTATDPVGRKVTTSQSFVPDEGPSDVEEMLANIERKNAEIAAKSGQPPLRTPAVANAEAEIPGARTTGSFDEGAGGLSDMSSGRLERHEAPVDPNALARAEAEVQPPVSAVRVAAPSAPPPSEADLLARKTDSPPNLQMGSQASPAEMMRDIREQVNRGVGGDSGDVPEVPSSSTTPEAPSAPAGTIRLGGAPTTGVRLNAGNFERFADALKQDFGTEIEKLRTATGSLPAAKELKRLHPDELGNWTVSDLQKMVDHISGGESGQLPSGIHPETGETLGRGMADVDRRMKGMSHEQRVEYYLRLPENANGAIRNYLRRIIWPEKYMK